jgi:hypothetical protein
MINRHLVFCGLMLLALTCTTLRPAPAISQSADVPSTSWSELPPAHARRAAATTRATPTQTSSTAHTYPLFEQGLAVRTGDVNHDGLNDVVLTTWEDRLRVWIQNPACHGLQERQDITLGPYPIDLAIADLNGDTRNDVVVVHSSHYRGEHVPGSVSILLQSPAGLATNPISYTVGANPRRVAVGDVSGDGRLDIVVSSDDNLDVLTQQPGGTFALTIVNTPSYIQPYEIGIADFTGDGRNDIALQPIGEPAAPPARIFRQLAGGGFALYAELAQPVGVSLALASSMAVGDFTGDGRADIAMTFSANTPYARIAAFVQKADHTFGSPTVLETYDNPTNAKIVDMNGDGRLDVVMLNDGYGSYTTHYQQPNGTLGPAVSVSTNNEIQSRMFTRDSDIGDITGDAKPDIAYTSRNIGLAVVAQSAVPICPNPSSPPPARPPTFLYASINYQNLAEMARGDLNGDGRQDFMTLETNLGTYSVRVVRQRADGGFTLLAQPAFSNNLYLAGLSIGDLNSDGKLDFAVSQVYTDTVVMGLQAANGSFLPGQRIKIGSGPAQTFIADWTGDGKRDLAVVATDGLYILAQLPNGTLAPPVLRAAGLIGSTVLVTTADWNRDGRMDVIGWWDSQRDSTSNVRVLLQQADGSFQLLKPAAFTPIPGPDDVQVGDVNGDGRPDIVLSHAANSPIGKLAIILQQPDGSLGSRTLLSDAGALGFDLPGGLALTDLNGDQRTDILVMNGWLYFSAFTQNQAHTFDPIWRSYTVATLNRYTPHCVAVLDENNDGVPEVIGMASPDGYLLFLKPLTKHAALPLVQR